MSYITFEQGSTIFQHGDVPDNAYVIEDGIVEISLPQASGKNKVLAVLKKGEIFGEMGLIDQQPRSATATAVARTVLVAIDRPQILTRLEMSDPVVVHMFKTITQRLRDQYGQRAGSEPADERGGLLAELKLERQIRDGISQSEFRPFLQPIVNLEETRVDGFEALVRWCKPDGTMVPPSDFIPLAERTHLIRELDFVVMDGACKAIGEINRGIVGGRMPTFVSVNLSSHHFSDAHVVDAVERVLSQTGLDPTRLKLEITESALISDNGGVGDVLNALKALGCRIPIDDFGTGYSSLGYLQRYPIDVMKIDRLFVSKLASCEKTSKIVKALIDMGKSLGMQIIAEGVEDRSQADILRDYGAHFGQGWLFGKPMPVEQARALL